LNKVSLRMYLIVCICMKKFFFDWGISYLIKHFNFFLDNPNKKFLQNILTYWMTKKRIVQKLPCLKIIIIINNLNLSYERKFQRKMFEKLKKKFIKKNTLLKILKTNPEFKKIFQKILIIDNQHVFKFGLISFSLEKD